MTITVPEEELVASASTAVEVKSQIVVLDTSVLVADPESMFAFGAADVVLPLTVLEELDELKARPDDVGRCARTAVRSLEQLRQANGGTLDQGVALPGGGTLRIELNGLRIDRLEELHLDVNKPDNRILAAGLALQREGKEVELVSADGSLRVKAAALGLSAADYTRRSVSLRPVGDIATFEVPGELVDTMYMTHRVDVTTVSEAAEEQVPEVENASMVLRAGTASVLCRRRGETLVQVPTDLSAWGLRPRSAEQSFALDLLLDDSVPVVSLEGHAGTGKTLLALAAGLEQVFESSSKRYSRMMILRPVVAVGRQELGYLPGDRDEKLGPWFEAIVDAMVALREDTSHARAKNMLDGWVRDGQMTLDAVSYLRGRSLQDTWIILDEAQNFETSVLKTVLTRIGTGSKIVCIGDVTQIDSPFLSAQTNALAVLGDTFADSELFGHVTLTKGERSEIADLAAARL